MSQISLIDLTGMDVAVANLLAEPLTLARLREFHRESTPQKVMCMFTQLVMAHRYVEAHSLMMISEDAGLHKVRLSAPVIVDVVRGADQDHVVEHDPLLAEPFVTPMPLMDSTRRWFVSRLHVNGASAETCDANGVLPLVWAVRLKDRVMVYHLATTTDASVNCLTPGGVSLLVYAVQMNLFAMVRDLINLGADPRWVHPVTKMTLLHYAAYFSVTTMILRELFDAAPDLDIDQESADGLTPLTIAILSEREHHIIELLIERGATIQPSYNQDINRANFHTENT
jgi:hypothetical protein